MSRAPPGAGFASEPDPWLGALLARPALRLVPVAGRDGDGWAERLDREALFVTAKVAAENVPVAGRLQDIGFRVVETALTFTAGPVEPAAPNPGIRFARPGDRDAVARIAADCLTRNRFHLDPALPRGLARQIKAAWASGFFEGRRGDGMVVAERGGALAGFLLLIWSGSRLVIDLVAVASDAARQGLARAMIAFAGAHGTGDARRPAGYVVGTQAANPGAVRFYEALGFRLEQAQLVLHHHGTGGRYPGETGS